MESGINVHGHNLIDNEIEFEIVIEPEGLNEKHTTKLIIIP